MIFLEEEKLSSECGSTMSQAWWRFFFVDVLLEWLGTLSSQRKTEQQISA